MSGKSILRWSLLLGVLALSMSLLVEVRETASASALSVGSSGLFTARRYLEERGLEVTLLDRPLDEAAPASVLVLAFPWQRGASRSEQAGIQQHLLRGGTIVLGYSGEGALPEREAMSWLGLSPNELRDEPPLGFFSWRAHANEEWSVTPALGREAPPLRISAVARAPLAPVEAQILYEGPKGEPLVFVFSSLNGRVFVLPSEAIGNARLLGGAGNADLLESLLASLGPDWSFDEYHHGLVAATSEEQSLPRFAFDLFLLHLGILYVLLVWRLARSFGPVWPERAAVSGSTRTFLLGLGSLHDRLGHHGDAAELLVRRARELHPRMKLEEAGIVRTGAELTELGARVARGQAE